MRINKFSILLISILALLVTSTVTVAAVSNNTNASPENTVMKYFEFVQKHNWQEAYKLTTDDFQEKIPLTAFGHFFESSHYTDGLLSIEINNTEINENVGEADTSLLYLSPENTQIRNSVKVELIDKAGSWYVNPKWEDFLSSKLETQPPLSIFQKDGVSIALRYIVLYPSTEFDTATTRIRLDIENNSNHTLQWKLPSPDASNYFIEDVETGAKYMQKNGYGWLLEDNGGFSANFEKDPPYVATAAPLSKGTIFLHFNGILDNVGKMRIRLDGFSFEDSESITVIMENIPPIFDITPTR
jgi:hypothetical protein